MLSIRTLSAMLSLGLFILPSPGTPAQREMALPVVGVILAKSGPAAYIGGPEEAILRSLARQPGQPFRLEIVDSGGKPATARQQFERFAQDPRVCAVIGPSTSGESLALGDLADENRLPLLSLAVSRNIVLRAGKIRPFVFKFAQNDDLAADRLLRAMASRHVKRLAFFHSNDGFGNSGREALSHVMNRFPGINLVHDKAFPEDLREAGALVGDLPPADAVLVWGTSPGPAAIVTALRARNFEMPIYLSHGNATHEFVRDTRGAAEGAILVGSRLLRDSLEGSDPSRVALRQYRGAWRSAGLAGPPSHFAGHARDAYLLLREIFLHGPGPNGPDDRREWVRKRIEMTPTFFGVTGTFRFSPTDHAGLDDSAFDLFQIRKGHFRLLSR